MIIMIIIMTEGHTLVKLWSNKLLIIKTYLAHGHNSNGYPLLFDSNSLCPSSRLRFYADIGYFY